MKKKTLMVRNFKRFMKHDNHHCFQHKKEKNIGLLQTLFCEERKVIQSHIVLRTGIKKLENL